MASKIIFLEEQTLNEYKNLLSEASHRQEEYTDCYDALCSAVMDNSDHVGEFLAQCDASLGSLRLAKYELADFVMRNPDFNKFLDW